MPLPSPELITAEELLNIPDPLDRRCELVAGVIQYRPFMDFGSGAIASELNFRLSQHVHATRCGIFVATGTGYILRRNPDTVRAATASCLSEARLNRFSRRHDGYFPSAPNLVVELLSDFDDEKDIDRRNSDWFDGGAKLVWVVNPRWKTVTVYRSATDKQELSLCDSLVGAEVLPGFVCPLTDIFPAE